jgi:hypothetical protein
VGSAFVVGGLATAAALPFLAAVRGIGGSADRIVGTRAGVESPCAAAGLPAVATVEARAVAEPEPAVAAAAARA